MTDRQSPAASHRAFQPDAQFIEAVTQALQQRHYKRLESLLQPLHIAEVADLLEVLHAADRAALFAYLKPVLDPELLTYVDAAIRDELLHDLPPADAAAAVGEMDAADAAQVITDLTKVQQEEILAAIPAAERAEITDRLQYNDDSAGRLMQTDVITVPQSFTVGQALDYATETGGLPHDFYDIYVVDEKFLPVGVVLLSRLLRARRTDPITQVMNTDFRVATVNDSAHEVARLFTKYGIVSLPVVGTTGQLVGVLKIDHLMDVLHNETESDLMKLSGVNRREFYLAAQKTARLRFGWLLLNLLTAVVASLVIGQFAATIQQLVALAVLMPIVVSMASNAGTQTLTVAVRAMALQDLNDSTIIRALNKELIIGVLNGLAFAALCAAVAVLWFNDWGIAGVMAVAVVVSMIVAGVSGVLIPLILSKLKIDPAVSSTVILTTITDVVGFAVFLWLAAWLLL